MMVMIFLGIMLSIPFCTTGVLVAFTWSAVIGIADLE